MKCKRFVRWLGKAPLTPSQKARPWHCMGQCRGPLRRAAKWIARLYGGGTYAYEVFTPGNPAKYHYSGTYTTKAPKFTWCDLWAIMHLTNMSP